MSQASKGQRSIQDIIEALRKQDPALADELSKALDHEYEVRLPDLFKKAQAPVSAQGLGEHLGTGCKVNVRYSGHCTW
jgi:hypothetical protein